MGRSIATQRDEAMLRQLADIKESIAELKMSITTVAQDLGTVRLAELAEVRSKIAALELALTTRIASVDATIAVLKYQAKRSGAAAGAWISAVISVLVAAGGALLLRH